MSMTRNKIPLARALALADDFAALFPGRCFERWQLAGSARRKKLEVGDLEFVAIPRFELVEQETDTMFGKEKTGEAENVNLLWKRVDDLVANGTISRVETDAAKETKACWGPLQRRLWFRETKIEIYTVGDMRAWGPNLAVRTGPSGLSKYFVEQLRKQIPPHCCAGGFYVRRLTGKPRETDESIVDCPTEEMFFGFCGMRYIAPELRKD